MEKLTLEIGIDHKDELVKYFKEKISYYEKQINEAKDAIRQLNRDISKNDTADFFRQPVNEESYDAEWSWIKKIRYALKENGKCLKSGQIIHFVKQFEPNNNKISGAVSGTIKVKIDAGVDINRYKTEGGEYYVGLKEWFDEKGNILEEYKASEIEKVKITRTITK